MYVWNHHDVHATHLHALFKHKSQSSPLAVGIHADSVVAGITLTCAILLIVMILTVANYYFVYKSDTVFRAPNYGTKGTEDPVVDPIAINQHT